MGTEETRRRIVRAVMELHEEVGPASSTVTAIAERAGVQRLTVYRHFPDDGALIQACSARWREEHPAPDPAQWAGIPEPRERARTALRSIYGYFRKGAPMLEKVLRDVEQVPELAETIAPWATYLGEIAGGLAAGWGVAPEVQRLLRAAAGHALRFETWRTLSEEGLSDEEAAELMSGWLACTAGGPPGTRRTDGA